MFRKIIFNHLFTDKHDRKIVKRYALGDKLEKYYSRIKQLNMFFVPHQQPTHVPCTSPTTCTCSPYLTNKLHVFPVPHRKKCP